MKITAIILLSAALQVSAKGLSQNVTLSVKDAPLEKVFESIKRQTGYDFFYYQADLQKAKVVSLDVRNARLDQVLNEVFENQPLTYTVIDRSIVIKVKVPAPTEKDLPPPAIPVRGKVTDSDGKPLSGASVKVKGTKTGATTNDDGEFVLNDVNENAILEVSFIGYETREVNVDGRTDHIIRLTIKVADIGGVAVSANTGYYKVKPNETTGSVVVITKAQLDQRIAPNIIDKLEGITNGLVFNKDASTGKSKLRIRGESTIFGYSEPLVVVDNFPYPIENINDINPNDVESITILKDAAAASIWGARAGNGVIVITTKKGKINQPLKLELYANTTVTERPNLFYQPLIHSSDFVDFETFLFSKGRFNSALINPEQVPVSPVVEILNNRKLGLISAADSMTQIDALRSIDSRNDALKYIYQKAITQQYQFNLSGGSNKAAYYFSAGFDNTKANLIGNENNRFTINSSTSYRPFKKLEAQIGVNYDEQTALNKAIPETNINNYFPYTSLVDANGNQLPIPQRRAVWEDTIVNHGFLDMKYYPLRERNFITSTTKVYTTRLSTQLQYSILNNLKASIGYQYYRSGTRTKNLIAEESYFIRNNKNTFAILSGDYYVGTNYPSGGQLDLATREEVGHNGRFQLDYSKNWNDQNLSAIAGFEVGETKSDGNSSRFYGYDDATGTFVLPDLYTAYNTYIGATPTGSSTIGPLALSSTGGTLNRFRSYFTNVSYTYSNRYSVSASVRLDQANIFGVKTNQKGAPLWSAGGKWDISKEKFYKSKLFPELALRITYGYQGNISPKAVAVTTIRYEGNADYTGFPFSVIDNFPNQELRWEKLGQVNLGLSFVTKNLILSGSIEYFQKNGKDLFGNTAVDPTTGISTLLGNFSDMKSKGLDLVLTTKNINRQFKWSTTFIFNYASEKVTRYDAPANPNATKNVSFKSVTPVAGFPLYSIWSYRWGGLDPATGDPRVYLGDTLNKAYNALTVSRLKLSDLVYSGRYNPPFYGAMQNNISWRTIGLSFNLTYKLGHYFRRSSIKYSAFANDWRTGHEDYTLRWQKPGDEQFTNVPSFRYPIPNSVRDDFYNSANILVEKADHIRLQYIDLHYSFSDKLVRKIKMQSFSVHFYASNLGVIWRANDKKIDPDYPYLSSPPSRSYSLGINASF